VDCPLFRFVLKSFSLSFDLNTRQRAGLFQENDGKAQQGDSSPGSAGIPAGAFQVNPSPTGMHGQSLNGRQCFQVRLYFL
jgi:hypothetical protein